MTISGEILVLGALVRDVPSDADHHPFRYWCSLELKAPPVRTQEGPDGGEDSHLPHRRMEGTSQARHSDAGWDGEFRIAVSMPTPT